MLAKLTTHVLDTAHGCPARGLRIELWSRASPAPKLLKTVCTNDDGRVEPPLLAGAELAVGEYELVFLVGDYFAEKGASGAHPDTALTAYPGTPALAGGEGSMPHAPSRPLPAEASVPGAASGRARPSVSSPRFLDRVPVRFSIADAASSYHVPLLCSPYGYTTYRGS